MTTYLKITLPLSEDLQELFISEFDAIPFTGFEQHADTLDAYVNADDFSENLRSEIRTWLTSQDVDVARMTEERIEEQNWNENWEKSLRPVHVAPFFITPTWSDDYRQHPDLIPIFIDPKMAFGTGYHETTRLILRLLPSVVEKGQRVLDVGTGTGILAIGALKLGAERAVGVDIDEWSFDNALENAERNNVSEQLIIKSGSLEAIPEEEKTPFDLVLANINRNALLSIAEQLTAQVLPGGVLVLSGLLAEDEPVIRGLAPYKALIFVEKMQENDWIALVFKKSE